jgi:hypothetical protein
MLKRKGLVKVLKRKLCTPDSRDWYERCIEEPLREIVRRLRNEGINTTCSCAHASPMYIECHTTPGAEDLLTIHKTVWSCLHVMGKRVNFEVELRHFVNDGHSDNTYIVIRIPR